MWSSLPSLYFLLRSTNWLLRISLKPNNLLVMLSAQTNHEGTRAAVYRQSMLISRPKTLLSVIRKGTDRRRDFRKKTEDEKRRSLGPSLLLLKNVDMIGKLQFCLCLFVSISNLCYRFSRKMMHIRAIFGRYRTFAILRYLLIIGKKQNMQVLSHTFTYFST